MKRLAALVASLLPALTLLPRRPAEAAPPFFLRPQDRVVFYGDSITEQRQYTTFVETFVVTRFPTLDVRFVHSGWGGDRVSGGNGGVIQQRLERDVFAHRPTVVTVMLGMNDGRYRPFDRAIHDTFTAGYDELVRSVRGALPGARLTLIQPSPYDEVTRPPMAEGSYNDVLLRFGAHVRKVAARERVGFADLNTDLVEALRKANAANAELAQQIVRDRVHPGPAGHLVMAGSLLKAWNAPALVSSVEIDARAARVVDARGTRVAALEKDGAGSGLRWTQLDAALPFPLDTRDPVMELAVKSSTFVETLNQQPLKVTGLAAGPYALSIDDQQIGVFAAAELGKGVNLATLATPMARQAAEVHALTGKHVDIRHTRWRAVELRVGIDESPRRVEAEAALDAVEEDLVRRQRAAARPRPRRFTLRPVSEVAARIPAGFSPVFGGGSLRHVLLAGDRHRDVEIFLEVQDGAPAGALLLRFDGREKGYRVSLDPREEGAFGRVERAGAKPPRASKAPAFREHWKAGAWNTVRVRMQGDRPRVTVWLNGAQITDFTDDVFPAPGGDGEAAAGLVALQLPDGGGDGALARVRNLALKPLP
jgi:lysophospholipase L1-like esterase